MTADDTDAWVITDEAERKARDKKAVKFCPVCGKRPGTPPDKPGRHIYTIFCEKCQSRTLIHVNG